MHLKDLNIIDTHLHVWDLNKFRYPWLDNIPQLNKTYLLDDYDQATEGLNIEKMVFVQCEAEFDQFQEEAAWVTELAKIDPRLQGIVPWAPLEKEDQAQSALEKLASNPLVKGIRRIIEYEDDPEFCLRSGFIRGVQLLEDFDLSFDITISHDQFKNTIKFVRECPNVRFILDHLGKPDIKGQLLDPWKADIKRMSEFPNVHCKVSHMTTKADLENWKEDDLKPFLEHIVECFGFDRLVFGGDWPPVELASSYEKWVETLLSLVSEASVDEKEKLFSKNAEAFYRL